MHKINIVTDYIFARLTFFIAVNHYIQCHIAYYKNPTIIFAFLIIGLKYQ